MAKKVQAGWIWLAAGAVIAVAVAVGLGVALSSGHKNDPKMNDQPTGMTFNVSDSPVAALDPKKTLRCYVNGADVGDMTLAECAQKNGMAAQKMDVGLDDNGNVVAAPTGSLTPTPPAPASAGAAPGKDNNQAQVPEQTAEQVPDTAPAAASSPTGVCLRYNSNSWNKLQDNVTLGQCVQMLYDQRCVSPGNASYGRWADKTLRLVPHRVEISDDNTNFRPLVDQEQGCSVPMVH